MIFILGGIATALTITMFTAREMMLGYPSVMFWAILGAHAYTLSTTPWGDIYFYLFFASAFGMTIFCVMAMYGLREKRDTIGEEEMEKGEGAFLGESEEEAPETEKPLSVRERIRKRRMDRLDRQLGRH